MFYPKQIKVELTDYGPCTKAKQCQDLNLQASHQQSRAFNSVQQYWYSEIICEYVWTVKKEIHQAECLQHGSMAS